MRNKIFFFQTLITKILMKLQGIKYGKNFHAYGIPLILKTRNSSIKIGDNVSIASTSFANLSGLAHRSIIFAKDGGVIEIGNGVGISGTIHCKKRIIIGNNVLVGANSVVMDHNGHPLDPIARMKNLENLTEKGDIIIGDSAFIGYNSIILGGTSIGKNTVIGAGSVVRGNFEDNLIVAGNPARPLRKINFQSKSG